MLTSVIQPLGFGLNHSTSESGIEYRIVANQSTTSSHDFLPVGISTGATCTPHQVETLITKATSFVTKAAALPIDEDMDKLVDGLVEKTYLNSHIKPLTRKV